MENEVIAVVRIAPGELGYYDEVSNTFLTQEPGRQKAEIKAGTNCSVLRRSVKCGRLILVSGSLGRSKTFKEILKGKSKVVAAAQEEKKEPFVPVTTLEVMPEPEKPAEEAPAEEAAEEKKPAKKTRKKKADKEAEAAEKE